MSKLLILAILLFASPAQATTVEGFYLFVWDTRNGKVLHKPELFFWEAECEAVEEMWNTKLPNNIRKYKAKCLRYEFTVAGGE